MIDFLDGSFQLQIYDNFCNGYTGLPQNIDVDTGEVIDNQSKRGTGGDRSKKESLSRTKRQIYAYARANRWEWFVTLTFNQHNVDRYNYDACVKKLSQWLNNFKKRYAPNLKYLVVPEQHKDGAYHFHGLLACTGSMDFVDSGLRDNQNRVIYNIGNYGLGFTTATRVTDMQRCSSYLCKYITKALLQQSRKRYWASRNLNKPTEVVFLADKQLLDYIKCVAMEQSVYLQQKESDWNTITYIELEHMPDEIIALLGSCRLE